MSDTDPNELMQSILGECTVIENEVSEISVLAAQACERADSKLEEYSHTVSLLRENSSKHIYEIVTDLEKAVKLK